MPPVVQLGERIAFRTGAQTLLEAQIAECERELFGHGPRQTLRIGGEDLSVRTT